MATKSSALTTTRLHFGSGVVRPRSIPAVWANIARHMERLRKRGAINALAERFEHFGSFLPPQKKAFLIVKGFITIGSVVHAGGMISRPASLKNAGSPTAKHNIVDVFSKALALLKRSKPSTALRRGD